MLPFGQAMKPSRLVAMYTEHRGRWANMMARTNRSSTVGSWIEGTSCPSDADVRPSEVWIEMVLAMLFRLRGKHGSLSPPTAQSRAILAPLLRWWCSRCRRRCLCHVLRQSRQFRKIGQQDDLDAAVLAAPFGRRVLRKRIVLAIARGHDVLAFIFASTRKRVTTSARAIESSQLSLYVALTG